ncbi:MAG: DUF4363 family protein [Candidatus Heteroscillospira sp.]|jgi:hypothetical protein
MKRETAAVLALILLCAGAAWNVFYVRSLSEELCGYVEASREAFEAKDWTGAENELQRAIDRWLSPGSYTSVSMRHSEIDAVTDDFYELLSRVNDRSDECKGGYAHVLTGLRRLADIETPTLGSIF